jgi:hypothetical protein
MDTWPKKAGAKTGERNKINTRLSLNKESFKFNLFLVPNLRK